MKTIRIASGSGFWGDWLEAPIRQVRGGAIDYLVLDYLAEVTMSILAKKKLRDPKAGYADDFVQLIDEILPDICERNIKVISNAGGMNANACAAKIRELANSRGLGEKIKIGVVSGDDILPQLDSLQKCGEAFENLETGQNINSISGEISSANAYLGHESLVDALQAGANIIVTGRVADPSLFLAPMCHEFGWSADSWDLLASGILAGHIVECGAQASGGNCSLDWQSIPDLANIGFPIIEMQEDGTFVITKHPGTGGRIGLATVKEQMVYEIGDPSNYITPDVVADFTSAQLCIDGENRVKFASINGKERTDFYKVSLSYFAGYRTVGTMIYSWPDAVEKAKAAEAIIRKRIDQLGLHFDKTRAEIIGANALHGPIMENNDPELPEAMFRFAVQGQNKEHVARFSREVAPLVLGGPPFATGYAGGKGAVQEVIGYWPTLVARGNVQPQVTIV